MVADRLSPVDASFLYLEGPATAMHVTSVSVLQPGPDGFGHDRLMGLVAAHLHLAPRYRQRVRAVPAGLGGPVWVDDPGFDLGYHVRRVALPAPGSPEQLADFVALVQSRVLDRDRPLWELHLVEGLADGLLALVSTTHQAMVDGEQGLDITHLILRDHPVGTVPEPQVWNPGPQPTSLELVTRSAVTTLSSPAQLRDGLRGGLEDLRHTASRVLEVGRQAGTTLVRTAASPARSSPLNAPVGRTRRVVLVDLDLEDFRAVRSRRFGARDHAAVTVTDVILATLTGALRTWLMGRGEPVTPSTSLRAMVPVSTAHGHEPGPVVACFVDLPVGEPSAGMRLQQVAYRMAQQMRPGQAVGAAGIAGLAGFAPPTLHSMAARVAGAVSRRVFNLVVSNVPGPQQPRYVGEARMLASYPVIPLAPGQALAIGLTSYEGRVHIGLNADRAAMFDVEQLAEAVPAALEELLDAGGPAEPPAAPSTGGAT